MIIPISEIIIPTYFHKPAAHKIAFAKLHYTRKQLHPIKVEKVDEGWLLRDGFARYIGAKTLGATELEAVFWTEEDEIKYQEFQATLKQGANN